MSNARDRLTPKRTATAARAENLNQRDDLAASAVSWATEVVATAEAANAPANPIWNPGFTAAPERDEPPAAGASREPVQPAAIFGGPQLLHLAALHAADLVSTLHSRGGRQGHAGDVGGVRMEGNAMRPGAPAVAPMEPVPPTGAQGDGGRRERMGRAKGNVSGGVGDNRHKAYRARLRGARDHAASELAATEALHASLCGGPAENVALTQTAALLPLAAGAVMAHATAARLAPLPESAAVFDAEVGVAHRGYVAAVQRASRGPSRGQDPTIQEVYTAAALLHVISWRPRACHSPALEHVLADPGGTHALTGYGAAWPCLVRACSLMAPPLGMATVGEVMRLREEVIATLTALYGTRRGVADVLRHALDGQRMGPVTTGAGGSLVAQYRVDDAAAALEASLTAEITACANAAPALYGLLLPSQLKTLAVAASAETSADDLRLFSVTTVMESIAQARQLGMLPAGNTT